MTRQALETLYYGNTKLYVGYEIFDSMFDPHEYGIEESGMSTGCYKGYLNDYVIQDDLLFLDKMRLVSAAKEVKSKSIVNAKKLFPKIEHVFDEKWRMNTWNNLIYKTDFTGNFVGYNFRKDLKWPLNRYAYFCKYDQVFLFSFQDGKMLSVLDFTEDIKKLTKELNEPDSINNYIGETICIDGSKTVTIKKTDLWFKYKDREKLELEKLHPDLILLGDGFISKERMYAHQEKKRKLFDSKPDAVRGMYF